MHCGFVRHLVCVAVEDAFKRVQQKILLILWLLAGRSIDMVGDVKRKYSQPGGVQVFVDAI